MYNCKEVLSMSFEESCSLWPLKTIPCSTHNDTARIVTLMTLMLRSYFPSELLWWVTDLKGSSYDSKKLFAFLVRLYGTLSCHVSSLVSWSFDLE